VDLQLAYLAAPQNAAQVNSAQQAPAAAQAAAQSAFAEQLHKREETIAEAEHAARDNGIRTSPDGQGDGSGYTPDERKRREYQAPPDRSPLGLSADGEHFIDVTV
jgi:hypothetical protein